MFARVAFMNFVRIKILFGWWQSQNLKKIKFWKRNNMNIMLDYDPDSGGSVLKGTHVGRRGGWLGRCHVQCKLQTQGDYCAAFCMQCCTTVSVMTSLKWASWFLVAGFVLFVLWLMWFELCLLAQGTSKARPAAHSAKQTPSSSSKPAATPMAPFSMGSGFANLASKYRSCFDTPALSSSYYITHCSGPLSLDLVNFVVDINLLCLLYKLTLAWHADYSCSESDLDGLCILIPL